MRTDAEYHGCDPFYEDKPIIQSEQNTQINSKYVN
jgi:hypothetical protein